MIPITYLKKKKIYIYIYMYIYIGERREKEGRTEKQMC